MKVFIFGAGASFGSQDPRVIHNPISPITKTLFDKTYYKYAQVVGIRGSDIQTLKTEVLNNGGNLEKYLSERWERINSLSDQKKQKSEKHMFSRLVFYIWWVLQSVSQTYDRGNYYYRLIKHLDRNGLSYGLISFNYDTLLDRALEDVLDISLQGSMKHYHDNDLVKPHGSVNWLMPARNNEHENFNLGSLDRKVRLRTAVTHLFDSFLPVASTNLYSPDSQDLADFPNSSDLFQHNGGYFYPLIMLPLTSKQNDYYKSFVQQQVIKARELVTKAKDIYFIGYEAKDSIIEEILEVVAENKQSEVKIHVVAKEGAVAIYENLRKFKGMGSKKIVRGHILTNGFQELLQVMKIMGDDEVDELKNLSPRA